MDDRVVPVVCALDRHQDFKIAKTFIGPFSSVNSVRFSPVLYQQDGIKSVFAMGDNDGNISFWHLNSKFPEKPIFLLKNTSGELIEDIAWSRDGSVMMATTMRRYIIIVVFDDEETLGVPLSAEAHTRHLDEVYGGAKQQVVTSNSKFTSIRTYNSYDQPAA
jgi:protein HIRA/HIR1